MDELIFKRCNEIIDGDEKHKTLNKEILDIEKDFLKGLSQEKHIQYIKLEGLIMNLINYDTTLVYTHKFIDK